MRDNQCDRAEARLARRTVLCASGGLIAMTMATAGSLTARALAMSPFPAAPTLGQGSPAGQPGGQAGTTLLADLAVQSSAPIVSLLYRHPADGLRGATARGAAGVNARWEGGASRQWFIEEQRAGEVAAIGALLTYDVATIDAALRLLDWGFARQVADGSFAGSGDPFHSTSFFVAAAAHTCLFFQRAAASGQFPLAGRYLVRIAAYLPRIRRAARWMVRPSVWSPGFTGNSPFTHRRYLVGAALGLSGALTADSALIDRAHAVIADGLSLQRADGSNPERGGHDSSYQMTGVVFAQYWTIYLPADPLTPAVRAMIGRALSWEATRMLPTGEVTAEGNTRTAGQERGRGGAIKGVAYSRVIRGFATWAALTGDPAWAELAWRAGRHYYATPSLAPRPLLP